MLSTQLHIACCMHSACRPCSSDLPQASTHHPDTAKPVFRRLQRLQFSRHRCSRWKTYAPPPACGAGGAPRQRRLPLPAIPGKYQASALSPSSGAPRHSQLSELLPIPEHSMHAQSGFFAQLSQSSWPVGLNPSGQSSNLAQNMQPAFRISFFSAAFSAVMRSIMSAE